VVLLGVYMTSCVLDTKTHLSLYGVECRLRTAGDWFYSEQALGFLLVSSLSWSVLVATQPSIRWVSGLLQQE